MARKTKEEAEATREALLDAAERVFLERGVSHTSLAQIAREAGMTRGAVYWHFRDKRDLFDAMVDRVQLPMHELIADLRATGDRDPAELIRTISRLALCKLVDNDRYRRVYTILFHRCEFVGEFNPSVHKQQEVAQRAHETLVELFEEAERRGRLRPGISPRIAACAMHAYVGGLYFEWLRGEANFTLPDDADALLAVNLAGLLRDA